VIYALLVDEKVAGLNPMAVHEGTDRPISYADVRNDLDEAIATAAAKIETEPWVSDPTDIAARYFPGLSGPQHVATIRHPKKGKPNPETWGWQPSPGDGSTPPGLDP
jgi:hypothetical protein